MKSFLPYLTFDGTAREAMTFYQQAFGGELDVKTFAGSGMDADPAMADRVMHARLHSGPATLMASDGMPGKATVIGTNSAISVDCDTESEVDRVFAAMSAGGTATMPPQDTFWGARFGMLTDRYGVQWMFNYDKPTSS